MKYRPSCGSEGADFMEKWCANCKRDAAMNGSKDFDDCGDDDLCEIIARSLRCEVDDDDYPQEWAHDDSGMPVCTAFVDMRAQIRCSLTVDMFDAADGREG